MSLFDAIGSFFGGGGNVLGAAASLGGALLASEANKDAAEEARKGAEAQAAAIREGNLAAQARYEQRRTDSAPAMDYLRTLVAMDPSQLTPSQRRGMEDYQRGAQARLAASGLRGAGRAGVASINEGAAGYLARAYDDNQRRADSAARALASDYGEADTAMSNIDRDSGRAAGNAAAQGGYINANAGTANAQQWGTALGAIANLVAKENKERSSQYKPEDRYRGFATFSGGDPEAMRA